MFRNVFEMLLQCSEMFGMFYKKNLGGAWMKIKELYPEVITEDTEYEYKATYGL